MKVELKKLEIYKSPRKAQYALGCDSNDADNEGKNVYTTEFV